MRTLFRKELRELAPLGVLLALLCGLAWGRNANLGDYLAAGNEGWIWLAIGAAFVGVILGIAPFEMERWRGTQAYLLHRATTARAVVLCRLGASAVWAAAALGVAVLAGPVVALAPTYGIEGYTWTNARSVALTVALCFPGVGVGAVAGSLSSSLLGRATAAVAGALLLLVWGGRLTTSEILGVNSGWIVYATFLLIVAASLLAVSVLRFERTAHGEIEASAGVRVLEGVTMVGLIAPAALLIAAHTQLTARELALLENEDWTVTMDRSLHRRPTERWDGLRQVQDHRVRTRREAGETILFDCVQGDVHGEAHPMGSGAAAGRFAWWQLGRSRSSVWPLIGGGCYVWFDLELSKLIVDDLIYTRGARVVALEPAPGELPRVESPQIMRVAPRDYVPGSPAFVVAYPATNEVFALALQEAGPSLEALVLPENDEFFELKRGLAVRATHDGNSQVRDSEWMLVGREAPYVLRGDEFVAVESYEPPPPPYRVPISVHLSDHDGLRYVATLVDEESGLVVGRSEHGPRTVGEWTAATVAGALTLARSPLGNLASFAHTRSDAPAISLWIDPLVLGGRRPWLVALHQAFALGLAWLARRRLGGRAWGWPLAIMVLGVAAWLVCRLLEQRRPLVKRSETVLRTPGWAPIADRAGA